MWPFWNCLPEWNSFVMWPFLVYYLLGQNLKSVAVQFLMNFFKKNEIYFCIFFLSGDLSFFKLLMAKFGFLQFFLNLATLCVVTCWHWKHVCPRLQTQQPFFKPSFFSATFLLIRFVMKIEISRPHLFIQPEKIMSGKKWFEETKRLFLDLLGYYYLEQF